MPSLLNVRNIFLMSLVFYCFACKQGRPAKQPEIVKIPEQMDDQVSDNLKTVLLFAKENNGKINDSIRLASYPLVNAFYEQNNFKSIWSSHENFQPVADSLFKLVSESNYFGLYPEDYHIETLHSLRNLISTDSMSRMDAIAWTKAELMMTDAFMHMLKDLKQGRLLADSLSISYKKNYEDTFFIRHLNEAIATNSVGEIFFKVQPQFPDYISLQSALKTFVDSMDWKSYVYVPYPFKDSIAFVKLLQKRLAQSGFGDSIPSLPDSAEMSRHIKKYQAKHRLVADGKAGAQVVKTMNFNDREKFKRIAITLDRYKLLPPLPETYIWVNLPGFYLKLYDDDTLALESKVIVGKPATRTPVLNSSITDMVTYPQWTIPESIIKKDILPALKKDPGYLARKGFSLVDAKGEVVDPFGVDWTKYNKGIPWKVVQGSGDDNALGIFKFNFNNPYSVYLHDTNQRYLFKNADRALSHGCVRVQNWEALAFFIARSDSAAMEEGKTISYTTDSIKTWITNKSRKRIMVKKRLPLYIEYFTCEARHQKIVFFDDIYNEDRMLAQKYFDGK